MVGANPRYQSKHQRLVEAEPRPPLPLPRPHQQPVQLVRVGGRIVGEVEVVRRGLAKAYSYGTGDGPRWLGSYVTREAAAAALAAAWTREQIERREQ